MTLTNFEHVLQLLCIYLLSLGLMDQSKAKKPTKMSIRHLENVTGNLNLSMFAFEKIRCHDLKLGTCT